LRIASSAPARTSASEGIVRAQSVLGGSDYQVRAHNANSVGTAAARLKVTATTVEPLPHG
jgi:hypothetical protein